MKNKQRAINSLICKSASGRSLNVMKPSELGSWVMVLPPSRAPSQADGPLELEVTLRGTHMRAPGR